MPARFAISLLGLCLFGALLALLAPLPPVPLAPPPPPRIVLVAVGDILLGRQLGEEMARTGDYSIAFQNIRANLTSADLTFGNLEGPFCGEPPYPAAGMIFRFRPQAVESLLLAGFDAVSLANNHSGDGGDACLKFSLSHLRGAGIEPVGAGENYNAAHAPAILERHGIRFAFLGYTYAARNDTPEAKRSVVAGRDPENVRRDVAAAHTRADVVVVSLHDGAEYTTRVARETEQFARAAIDAGASLVLGHHPHVPQRVEAYNGGWIFYSLGNFAFQQNTPASTRTALLARIAFSGRAIERVEALPVVIEWFAQPRLANEEESAPILKSVGLDDRLLWPVPASQFASSPASAAGTTVAAAQRD